MDEIDKFLIEMGTITKLKNLQRELEEFILVREQPLVDEAAKHMDNLEHCDHHATIQMGGVHGDTVYFEWTWCPECGEGGEGIYIAIATLMRATK